jgi:shikimate kinase
VRPQTDHVLLIGFMGSGKSSVGRSLAVRLGIPFVDLDQRISTRAGLDIPQIFAREGEQGFRDRETQALESMASEPRSVIACGGGIVLREENRELLRELGTVIYLEVGVDEAIRRCGRAAGRPLLDGRTRTQVAALLEERAPMYASVADVRIPSEGESVGRLAARVEEAVRRGDLAGRGDQGSAD